MALLALCGAALGAGAQSPPLPPATPPAQLVELGESLIAAADDAARNVLLDENTTLVARPLYDVVLAVGRKAWRGADRARATAAFKAAILVAERSADKPGLALAHLHLGQVYGAQGDHEASLQETQAGRVLSEELGDKAMVATAINNTANISILRGDYDEALTLYGEALTLSRSLGDTPGIVRRLSNIGYIHHLRGDYRRALEYYEEARPLVRPTSDSFGILLDHFGEVHRALGNIDAALGYLQRSLELAEGRGDKAAVMMRLHGLGELQREEGHFELATPPLERAAQLAAEIGDKGRHAEALASLAELALERQRTDEARDLYRRSADMARAVGERRAVTIALEGLARTLSSSGRHGDALAPAEESVQVAEQAGMAEQLWRAQVTLGRAHERLGQRPAAERAYRDAMAVVEDLRERVAGDEGDRERFLESRLAPYHALVNLLAEAGDAPGAFLAAEQARARALVDVLQRGRLDVRADMTEAEHDRERGLEHELAAAHARLDAEERAASPTRNARRAALEAARAALDDYRARLFVARPRLRLARGATALVSWAEAGALLDEHTTVLAYVAMRERTLLFVLSRGPGGLPQVDLHSLALGAAALRVRVAALRERLAARDLDYAPLAVRLWAELVAPARERLRGHGSVVVIPDGALWEVPFAALQPRPGHDWIESAAITVAPSLTALGALRARAGIAPAAGLMAVGNPGPVGTAGGLGALPQAERQVRALEVLYGPRHSRVYVGPAATEAAVKRDAGRYGILHFATHAAADDAAPLFSHLQLAPGGAADPDGRLEAREIMELELHASLAVLSACETGRGRVGAGEGIIGLAWAFAVAGSPNVVASHWKVDASASSTLMLALHRRLRAPDQRGSKDVAEALRLAALELRRRPEYRHPFYWAAFFLVGGGRV